MLFTEAGKLGKSKMYFNMQGEIEYIIYAQHSQAMHAVGGWMIRHWVPVRR